MNLIEIVRDVAKKYPELLTINTNASCYEFITHVLARLKAEGYAGWGYVGKTNGEGQYRPPIGFPRQVGPYVITGVSHDAIGSANQRVDLLGGGNDGPDPLGTPAQPQWMDIPPEHWRPNNPIIVFDGPVPPPHVCPTLKVPSYAELGDDAFFRAMIGVPLQADYTMVGQQLNDGAAVWFSRATYRLMAAFIAAQGQPINPSAEVRIVRNEWRQILGLPPV